MKLNKTPPNSSTNSNTGRGEEGRSKKRMLLLFLHKHGHCARDDDEETNEEDALHRVNVVAKPCHIVCNKDDIDKQEQHGGIP